MTDEHLIADVAIQLRSKARLDCDGRILNVDDAVRLQLDGRVVGVAIAVDERTGRLQRLQTIRIMDLDFTAWHPHRKCLDCGSDRIQELPTDNGVVDGGSFTPVGVSR